MSTLRGRAAIARLRVGDFDVHQRETGTSSSAVAPARGDGGLAADSDVFFQVGQCFAAVSRRKESGGSQPAFDRPRREVLTFALAGVTP